LGSRNAQIAGCLLTGYRLQEGRDVLGVLALQETRWHASLPGPADLDRAQHASLGERADAVEIRAGDPAGVHGGERVAARAGGAEEGLALLDLGRRDDGARLVGGAL